MFRWRKPRIRPPPSYSSSIDSAPAATPSQDEEPQWPPPDYTTEPPPTYTPLDANVTAYNLCAPLITTAGDSIRYQLQLLRTRKGKLYRLCIRRLTPNESRRLSLTGSVGSVVPGTSTSNSSDASTATGSTTSSATLAGINYDADATMYTITRPLTQLGSGEAPIEIKGQRASTIPGRIILLQQGKRCCFYHLQRSPANDSLKEENKRKMEKYGYRPDDEWMRTLLFSGTSGSGSEVGVVQWRDGRERTVAEESAQSLVLKTVMEPGLRDLLVTCWMARSWQCRNL